MLDDTAVEALIAAAARVRECAYAPHSGFKVGAAVVTEDDRVFLGANVENASYGLSLCAERSAIAAAVAGGARSTRACVIVSDASDPATPCGACLQWLAEFGSESTQIICASTSGKQRRYTLSDLLPHPFHLE